MSDTKHNLLHLLKIITAPIMIIFVAFLIIEIVFWGFLDFAGFRCDEYEGVAPYFIKKWENLP